MNTFKKTSPLPLPLFFHIMLKNKKTSTVSTLLNDYFINMP
jgi:hypothetical protein